MFKADFRVAAIAMAVTLVVGAGASVAIGQPSGSDGDPALPKGFAEASWPQWRGPTRDGIAPAGPKLLDAWSTNGPKQVWKSGLIRGLTVEGGMSSVVVSGGKAIVYVNGRESPNPVVVISSALLKKWGWVEDMPEDLVGKLEAARRKKNFGYMKPGPALDAYIKDFLATLAPALVQKYGEDIRRRLTAGFSDGELGLPKWNELAGLARMRDKEYKTVQDVWADIIQNVGVRHNDDTSYFTRLVADAFPSYDRVIGLDAATGRELWRREFPGAFQMQLASTYWAASATPAIKGERCYVQGSAGVYCLSLQDGAEIWKKKTDFSHSSPLVLNDVVYTMSPCLTARNADTGRLLWKQEQGTAADYLSSTSVIPWRNGQKTFLITLASGPAPYCMDPDNGKIVWATPKSSATASATPIVVGDVLLGANKAMTLTPQGAETIWTLPFGADGSHGSSLTYFQGYVYAHPTTRCFDFKTGAEKWKTQNNSGFCYSAILADGKFIGCWGGFGDNEIRGVVMYRASPEKYEELGKLQLDVTFGASPAIVGGKLFLRLADGVACYDLRAQP